MAACALAFWVSGSGVADAADAPTSRDAASDTIRFVEHPETYPIGWPTVGVPLALTNPFEHDAKALATGAKLYIAYNCIDCHGAEGSGSMGPSLADGRWHFGGRDGEVFESIYQGRPEGMPAWGGRIANDQIWMLVAYVRSLNGGRDVSTENFTGRTVERTGH
ncbi:MAG: c-type cytochrome [Gemmatimonadaceae bacterium]|nr:c-type cytochrome [Gemmatimonadaceae bacterium]